MPRPREFDIDEALNSALELFWSKGYEAASMTDLLSAMDLSKSSFYDCFGCKRQLLLSALRRYSEREIRKAWQHFSAAQPASELLMEFFRRIAHPPERDDCQRRGCLIINAIVELAPHDEDVAAIVQDHGRRLGQVIAAAVARGRAEGDIRDDILPDVAADMLMALHMGLLILAKAGLESRRIDAAIDESMMPWLITR